MALRKIECVHIRLINAPGWQHFSGWTTSSCVDSWFMLGPEKSTYGVILLPICTTSYWDQITAECNTTEKTSLLHFTNYYGMGTQITCDHWFCLTKYTGILIFKYETNVKLYAIYVPTKAAELHGKTIGWLCCTAPFCHLTPHFPHHRETQTEKQK